MQITRKGYYTIERDGTPLTRPDGAIRQVTTRDECYEYITEDGRGGVFTIKCPDREVEMPLINIPGVSVVPQGTLSYGAYYARVPFAMQQPTEPTITREVTIATTGTQAATDAQTELATSGTRVIIPDGAGDIGSIFLGNVTDGELQLGHAVLVETIDFGTSGNPTVRVKWTGGRVRAVRVRDNCSDILFDNVIFDNDQGDGAGSRPNEVFYFSPSNEAAGCDRIGVFNSMVRILESNGGTSCFHLGDYTTNAMWANNNISTSGISSNAWGWRVQGGSNWAMLDNTVLIGGHKMIRWDFYDFSNMLIEGGTWMAEDGDSRADTWQQSFGSAFELGGVTIRDLECWLQSTALDIRIGKATDDPANGTFVLDNLEFHAPSSSIVSDSILQSNENSHGSGADYGIGTHSYTYNNPLTLPTSSWRVLPNLPNNGDPSQLADP